MTRLGEIRKEAQKPKGHIVAPKQNMDRMLNVRTMAQTSETAQVARAMRGNSIEIIGISECIWKGIGSTRLQSVETIMYVGDEDLLQCMVDIIKVSGGSSSRLHLRMQRHGGPPQALLQVPPTLASHLSNLLRCTHCTRATCSSRTARSSSSREGRPGPELDTRCVHAYIHRP